MRMTLYTDLICSYLYKPTY